MEQQVLGQLASIVGLLRAQRKVPAPNLEAEPLPEVLLSLIAASVIPAAPGMYLWCYHHLEGHKGVGLN